MPPAGKKEGFLEERTPGCFLKSEVGRVGSMTEVHRWPFLPCF